MWKLIVAISFFYLFFSQSGHTNSTFEQVIIDHDRSQPIILDKEEAKNFIQNLFYEEGGFVLTSLLYMGDGFRAPRISHVAALRSYLEKFIEKKSLNFCKKFFCGPKDSQIPCLSIAKEGEGYKIEWEETKDKIEIRQLTCSSDPSPLDPESNWAEPSPQEQPLQSPPSEPESISDDFVDLGASADLGVDGDLGTDLERDSDLRENTPSPGADFVLVSRQGKPAEEAPQKEKTSNAPSKILTCATQFGAGLCRATKNAFELFVESNKNADLLDPNTWNLSGQIYSFLKLWASQTVLHTITGITQNPEPQKRKEILLNDILKIAESLLEQRQHFTDDQYIRLKSAYEAAADGLQQFIRYQSIDLAQTTSQLSQITQILPNSTETSATSPAQSYTRYQTKTTLNSLQASLAKGAVAANPTFSDIASRPSLIKEFEILKSLLEFPFIKWPIQKAEFEDRVRTVPKKGARSYRTRLLELAGLIQEASLKGDQDPDRKIYVISGAPGNGKTSGIENMLIEWLQLPLCKITYADISQRNKDQHFSVTEFVKFKIADCMKNSFIERASGTKIRNGIVLFDDIDRLFHDGGELSRIDLTDRIAFFDFMKTLGDSTAKDYRTQYTVAGAHVEYPLRITDLVVLYTTNSIIFEFDTNQATNSENINALRSRLVTFPAAYADESERNEIIHDLWKPIDEYLHEIAHNERIKIDFEECENSLQQLLAADCSYLKNMNGEMGIRGLLALTNRFISVIKQRKIEPKICTLGDFDIKRETSHIGDYNKGAIKSLALHKLTEELKLLKLNYSEKINSIENFEFRKYIRFELDRAEQKNLSLETREQAYSNVKNFIEALVPLLNAKNDSTFTPETETKLLEVFKEKLNFLDEANRYQFIQIAMKILSTIEYNLPSNKIILYKQKGKGDLKVLNTLARTIGIPFCKIKFTDEIKTPIVKTSAIQWGKYQKKELRSDRSIYTTTEYGTQLTGVYDKIREVYYSHYNGNYHIFSNLKSGSEYLSDSVTESDWNEVVSSESGWIDSCLGKMDTADIPKLGQTLLVVDLAKYHKKNHTIRLIEALYRSIETGITRSTSGKIYDIRKLSVVVVVNDTDLEERDRNALSNLENGKKSILFSVEIHPVAHESRIKYANIKLNSILDEVKKDLRLSEVILNPKDRALFHLYLYLDLTAEWQQAEKKKKEKSSAALELIPLDMLIASMKESIQLNSTPFHILNQELRKPNPDLKSILSQEEIEKAVKKWLSTYQGYFQQLKEPKNPIHLETLGLNLDGTPTPDWIHKILEQVQKDHQAHLDSKEKKRQEREQKLREEQERRAREEREYQERERKVREEREERERQEREKKEKEELERKERERKEKEEQAQKELEKIELAKKEAEERERQRKKALELNSYYKTDGSYIGIGF